MIPAPEIGSTLPKTTQAGEPESADANVQIDLGVALGRTFAPRVGKRPSDRVAVRQTDVCASPIGGYEATGAGIGSGLDSGVGADSTEPSDRRGSASDTAAPASEKPAETAIAGTKPSPNALADA